MEKWLLLYVSVSWWDITKAGPIKTAATFDTQVACETVAKTSNGGHLCPEEKARVGFICRSTVTGKGQC